MTYTYIVNPETGEILFDLVHDLITQNIRAIKLIAKKLNAVLRQKRGIMSNKKEIIKVSATVETNEKAKKLLDDLEVLKENYFLSVSVTVSDVVMNY